MNRVFDKFIGMYYYLNEKEKKCGIWVIEILLLYYLYKMVLLIFFIKYMYVVSIV